VTTRVRFTGYSGQSYRKSRQTSVIRTRAEPPTIVSSGCGTTCPHTTIDSPAGLRCHGMNTLARLIRRKWRECR
jgi:hypothetical protein